MSKKQIRVVSAEIVRNETYLLVQRSAKATLPLLWEFPGGRVREGETDKQALQRALKERIGVGAKLGDQLMSVVHPYDGYDLTLVVYRCDIGVRTPRAGSVERVEWVSAERFSDYPFPGADQKTIDLLVGGM